MKIPSFAHSLAMLLRRFGRRVRQRRVQVFAQQVFDCLCHVTVPFGARFTFDEARYAARTHRKSCNQVDEFSLRAFNALRPELWTLESSP